MQTYAQAAAEEQLQTWDHPPATQITAAAANIRHQIIAGSCRVQPSMAVVERIGRSPRQMRQREARQRLFGGGTVVQLNGFSDTVDEADDALSYETPDRVPIAANMKKVARVIGPSGKEYIVAKGRDNAPPERLVREAGDLATLRTAGLDVPNVYKNRQTPAVDTSGVITTIDPAPFILMDYIDGTFVDMWKLSDKLRPAISKHFETVPLNARIAHVQTLTASLTRIANYLVTNIVVDLQLIIENGTGRAVIIDPVAISAATDEEALEKHSVEYGRCKRELAAALIQLQTISNPVVATRNGPPETKDELERLWEEDCNGDDDLFKNKIRAMLAEADMPSDDDAVQKYITLSGTV